MDSSGSETKRPVKWDDEFRKEFTKTLAFLCNGEACCETSELTL